jgi:phosphoribosylanthranilate isomerase
VSSGADAVGVILAPSKRRVTLEQAAVVFAEVPQSVARVGVFADAQADDVWEAVVRLGLAAVQFHGDEPPETCESAPAPVIKALRVGPGFDGADVDRYRGAVAALLLDTYVAGEQGGTGMAFDWSRVAGILPQDIRIVLAGGLGPGNVAQAVRTLRPYAVDVSSGVERSPGIKDSAKIAAFCDAVRAADREVRAG